MQKNTFHPSLKAHTCTKNSRLKIPAHQPEMADSDVVVAQQDATNARNRFMFTISIGVANIIFGSVLMSLYLQHAHVACGLNLLAWALVLATIDFTQAGIAFISMCLGTMRCFSILARVVEISLILARLGVLIWGTILVFSDNLWIKHIEGDDYALAACPNPTYFPFAVYIIAYWLCGIVLGSVKA